MMKKLTPTIKTLIGVIIILVIVIPAGLLVPRWLFAQEIPPQVGQGGLNKVEATTISKCQATIKAFTSSNKSKDVIINVPDRHCSTTSGNELAANATQLLQEALDKCQLVSALPDDDPDKRVDPSTKNPKAKSLKWRVKPDNTYLCSSPVTVTITWNGIEYILSWRSTNAS